MNIYTVTMRSVLYEVHTVEADSEEQARKMMEESGRVETFSWTEDTDIYDITPEEN